MHHRADSKECRQILSGHRSCRLAFTLTCTSEMLTVTRVAEHQESVSHRCLLAGPGNAQPQGRLVLWPPASLHLQRLGCHGHRPLERVVAANEARGVHKHAARDAACGAAVREGSTARWTQIAGALRLGKACRRWRGRASWPVPVRCLGAVQGKSPAWQHVWRDGTGKPRTDLSSASRSPRQGTGSALRLSKLPGATPTACIRHLRSRSSCGFAQRGQGPAQPSQKEDEPAEELALPLWELGALHIKPLPIRRDSAASVRQSNGGVKASWQALGRTKPHSIQPTVLIGPENRSHAASGARDPPHKGSTGSRPGYPSPPRARTDAPSRGRRC